MKNHLEPQNEEDLLTLSLSAKKQTFCERKSIHTRHSRRIGHKLKKSGIRCHSSEYVLEYYVYG
jgi:hypothetical protein